MMSGGTTTDAARYLRDTAKLMRERADAATRGRWGVDGHAELEPGCRCMSCHAPAWSFEVDLIDGPDCLEVTRVGGCGHVMHLNYPDAEHIASWDPTVARAVADLLDDTATVWETRGWGYDRSPIPPNNKVLALARAYRREVAS